MKKLLGVIVFLISVSTSFAQYPWPPQNLGAPNVAVRDSGGLIVRGMFMPPNFLDTSAANMSAYANQYSGSLIFTTSDSGYWARNPSLTQWIRVGTGGGGGSSFTDTVFVRFPLGVDTTTIPGRQIIFIRSPNGLVYGGVVTLDSCRRLNVTSAIYNLNYIQYSTLASTVTLALPDPSLPRRDVVVVDTNALVSVVTGTPAATPLSPYINPSSQWPLATIEVPAGVTCLSNVSVEIIYDEHLLVAGGEWDTDTSGTTDIDFDNPDNPYHLDTAAFVSTYTDQSRMIFSKTAQDTVTQGEVFQMWPYLNGELLNQLQVQWYLNDTAVTNNMVVNSYLNPLDSNEYMNVSIPMQDWTWSRNYFNKVVISFAGDDTSGAKGLYLDYLRLIKGIDNGGKRYVDSTRIIAGREYYYVNGIAYDAGAVGGGGGGDTLRFGIEDNLGIQDRSIDMQAHTFLMDNAGEFTANTTDGTYNTFLDLFPTYIDLISKDPATSRQAQLGITFNGSTTRAEMGAHNVDNSIYKTLSVEPDTVKITNEGNVALKFVSVTIDRYSPLSVNGNFADNTGNITIPVGGSIGNVGTGVALSTGTDIKRLGEGINILIDSTTTANTITIHADTTNGNTKLATQGDITNALSGIGGGSGRNIYNTDSTLAGDRTVTMDNHFLSLNGGNVLIGTGVDDGHTLRLTGSASFNLGSDATGDMFYRNSLGSFTRLPAPIGFTKPVLGFTTIPTWEEDSVGSGGGGGGGLNIYNSDSTLAGNRTVTMNNNWLSLNGGNVGIGPTSTSPGSLLTLSRDMPVTNGVNIVAGDTTGILLKTSAAATVSNSSSSPTLVFSTNGWNTTAGASQTGKFKMYASSGSSGSLLGNLYIEYSSNGGAYTQPFQLVGGNGNMVISGAFVAGSTITGTTHTGTNFVATRNITNNGTDYLNTSTVNYSAATPITYRSYYFNPTLTATNGVDLRAFENTVGNVVLNSTSGSTSIGSSDTIVGAKLAVTSTTGAFLPPRMTKAQRDKIYSGFTGSITEDGTGGTATNNTYIRAFTGGTGTGATGSFVVVSNVVTSVTILEYGTGYVAGDVLSATIGGITGFTWTISAVTAPTAGSVIYQTDNTPGLRTYNGTNWMRYTETAD